MSDWLQTGDFHSMWGSVREVTDSLADAFEIANGRDLTAKKGSSLFADHFGMIFLPITEGGADRHVTRIGCFITVDVVLSRTSFS